MNHRNAGIEYLDLRDGFLNLRILELIQVNRQAKEHLVSVGICNLYQQSGQETSCAKGF